MKKFNFIVIEGYDGSGKSTIAKKLCRRLKYSYAKKPEGLFQKARDIFDCIDTPLIERMSFYLGDCIRISSQTTKGNVKNIILDRYFYSTIAHHKGIDDSAVNLFSPFFQLLKKPEVVILVNPDFETSLKRMTHRGISKNDSLINDKNKFTQIYNNYRARIDVPIVEVLNSGSLDESI